MSNGVWWVVVAVVAAGVFLAWVMSRRGSGKTPPVDVSSAEEPPSPAAAPDVVEAAPVAAPAVVTPPPAPPPLAAPVAPPPPDLAAPVAPPPPERPPVPPESAAPPPPQRESPPVVVAPPPVAPPVAPRPPPVVIERVLALEPAEASDWDAAQPLTLLPAQAAAVSTAVAVRSAASPLQRVVLGAGTATAIARGDQAAMRAMAATHGGAARTAGSTTWLDSSSATALVGAALAALASDRFLTGLGDDVRELKAAVAALPPRIAALGGPSFKTLMQDLSRFTREARENYASAIAKLAFRERVGEAEDRAVDLWRDVVVRVDAIRQQMQSLASLTRFGEVQVEKGLSLYKDLQDQRTLQELAGRALAAARLLRISIGDAPVARGADAIESALAALDAGRTQDADLTARLTECERAAKGDAYVGKAEFEANRAAMRTAMERIAAASPSSVEHSLQAARRAAPLDAAGGSPHSLLVGPGAVTGTVDLRWLER